MGSSEIIIRSSTKTGFPKDCITTKSMSFNVISLYQYAFRCTVNCSMQWDQTDNSGLLIWIVEVKEENDTYFYKMNLTSFRISTKHSDYLYIFQYQLSKTWTSKCTHWFDNTVFILNWHQVTISRLMCVRRQSLAKFLSQWVTGIFTWYTVLQQRCDQIESKLIIVRGMHEFTPYCKCWRQWACQQWKYSFTAQCGCKYCKY